MRQSSSLTQSLTQSQESQAALSATVFRLYTTEQPNLATLTARYFDGATITAGIGLWKGKTEPAAVVEIIGTKRDMQRVFDLAGDIRSVNSQSSVLVTWGTVRRFDVDADAINLASV